MKSRVLMAAALVVSFVPAAQAQVSPGPDKVFVTKAAASNMFEIESSKVALTMAGNAEVKAFAQQMITDHEKAGQDLVAVAGDAVPRELDAPHLARLEKLKTTAPADFDAAYLDEQVLAHDEAVTLFTKYSEEANAPALKTFASKTLPVLKGHQEHVRQLDKM